MTDNARIRWDSDRRVLLDASDHVLVEYEPNESAPGKLEELQDITAGELAEALGHAIASTDGIAGPTAMISISYLPAP
ncbi:hypothetical protein AB0L63_32605 [Nocardia sp. NPDC051990]|uniref:hypothetical protein n=1 Tax=Nocardia sp. NPDC051990 TaxID=3155285 RepID=UPI003440EC6A